ncbi:Glycosyltransferase involved in cell wall bisynthesis [Pseudomonas guariconensis]|uniref:Glycosyl transferase family 1 domain-containing protein n=1 Tax=Pseudomonas putida TaxID=303 RepID=A0A6S5TXX5_PSEPU|nr:MULTISPECIES: glycosyltransferase family 4 protein [Pseudomonas]BBT41362.1 hypothetical protein WP8W18C01_37030 [Pseudomonas putida]SDC53783.1 Glycosyltransferase involved in cell wall bisynthesis [Pseudomonas guariconensis]
MNIVMLCTKFSLVQNDPWLTNELADALQAQGHSVSVLNLDWAAKAGTARVNQVTPSGVRVISVGPVQLRSRLPLLSRLVKWVGSSYRVVSLLRKQVKDAELVIGFSPAVTMALPLLWLRYIYRVRSYMVLWDFFPYHQQQIGLLPSGLIFRTARWIENLLIRCFDQVGCMSLANIAYLKSHYDLRTQQKVNVLPIWGKHIPLQSINRDEVRSAAGLPIDRSIVIFGGQLVHGRGLEDLLLAARLSAKSGGGVHFLIMGSGTLESLVQSYLEEGLGNLTWIARVPRNDYLKVAQACDVALVCTVRNVDVPSFPSKTIDYLRLGLPIVASVEKSTDYGDFIVEQGVGVSVEAGQPAVLLACIEALLADSSRLADMGRRGPQCMAAHFDVDRVAALLVVQSQR